MLMKAEQVEVVSQIRDTVKKVCEEYGGEYWREKDRNRQYPTEFVKSLTELGLLASLSRKSMAAVDFPSLLVPKF